MPDPDSAAGPGPDHGRSPSAGIGRLLARVAGIGIALSYLVGGTVVVIILAIAGLWEGFGRTTYVLQFLAACVYIYGTVWLALRFARQPGKRLGLVLAVLVLPAVVHLALAAFQTFDLRETVRTYAESEDPAAVDAAREELLALGRRSGRQHHIEELLAYLQQAEDDAARIHIIELLAEIAGSQEPVLEALRALRDAAAHDPARQKLYRIADDAIHRINPYEAQPQGRSPASDIRQAFG